MDNLKPILTDIEAHFGQNITHWQALRGGEICHALEIHLANSAHYFLKYTDTPLENQFFSESYGLEVLRTAKIITIPEVILCKDNFLLLELLPKEKPKANFWRDFGSKLAKLHSLPPNLFDQQVASDAVGFPIDNYCGTSIQKNTVCNDGHAFFGNMRLLPQAQTAMEQGLLTHSDIRGIESICLRLTELIPEQASALIHGDLWSGNICVDAEGHAALIDPACYWGWPEADIAMTRLFSHFDDNFYNSYCDCKALESGWENRIPIYNLYHLLNHLNMFGDRYKTQVQSIIRRYQ